MENESVDNSVIKRREPEYTTNFPAYPSEGFVSGYEEIVTEQRPKGAREVRRDVQLGRTFLGIQVPVGSVDVVQALPPQLPSPSGGTRRSITILNNSSVIVFFDGARENCDSSHAFPLAAGGTFTLDGEPWGALYLIAASGSGNDVRLMVEIGYGGSVDWVV